MALELRCYRCGHSMAALTLPLSRRDECPQCSVELHVCRMCQYYAPRLPDACAEDDALEVKEKARANFCDYFKPSDNVYSPGELDAELAARQDLGALFGDNAVTESDTDDGKNDSAAKDAEALFKR